ncbi:hypothetical protein AALB16_00050 [Lachnospiraceae bacterium 62-35]
MYNRTREDWRDKKVREFFSGEGEEKQIKKIKNKHRNRADGKFGINIATTINTDDVYVRDNKEVVQRHLNR